MPLLIYDTREIHKNHVRCGHAGAVPDPKAQHQFYLGCLPLPEITTYRYLYEFMITFLQQITGIGISKLKSTFKNEMCFYQLHLWLHCRFSSKRIWTTNLGPDLGSDRDEIHICTFFLRHGLDLISSQFSLIMLCSLLALHQWGILL